MSGRGDQEKSMPASPTPAAPGRLPTPSDPAVQVVESAHQIVTMIGANPRAIRPILAQRRLTKEQVLAAAESVAERVAAVLAEMDTAAAERQAVHQRTVRQLDERISAWQIETDPGAAQRAEAPAEIERLQAERQAADAAFARFQAEQRGPRTFLTRLSERTAEVQRVYQAV
jgi:hypothetical protein